MEPTLLRLLRLSGIHFEPFGPAIEHRGLRQPCCISIGEMLARVRRERPSVWAYLTEDDTLRLETNELVSAV